MKRVKYLILVIVFFVAMVAMAIAQSSDLAPYKKLCSEAFVKDYANKPVHFKAMFVGEWTITQPYQQGGIKTEGRVFVNHRDGDYKSSDTGLGSSDMAFPEFALSVAKDKSDIVYELKKGDLVEVWGKAEIAGLPGKKGLHILAEKIQKVTAENAPQK